MKYDHDVDYFYKYVEEEKTIRYKFTNDLGSSESLSTCTATVTDSSGNDTTSSMLDDKTVNATNVVFDVKSGTSGETYQVKLVGVSDATKTYTHYITFEVFGTININAKLGDSHANSYVTLKEANDYIRNKYGHDSMWDSMSVEGKKRLLIESTKDVDRFNYIDDKYYDSQALAFPRDTHDTIIGNCATPITNTSFRNSNLYSDTYGVYPTSYWKYGSIHITDATPVNDIRAIASSNVLNGSITIDSTFSATPTTNTEFILFAPLFKEIKDAQCEQALFIKNSESVNEVGSYRNLGSKSVSIGDVSVTFDSDANVREVSPVSRKLLSRWIKRRLVVGRR